ncbi:MAG: RNA polymerase sigma-70 factor [Cyclobacteriaceae bacterium]
MSEEQILVKLRNGNQTALEKLFEEYYTQLTRYAIKIVSNPEVAEEIVQDVFVSIWNNREKNSILSAQAYLSKAVRNRCINHIKSNFPIHENVESSMHVVSDSSPDSGMETRELSSALAAAERKLPSHTAKVFALSRHTELTYTEISKELDISVKTVEYHISKALKSIKEFLVVNDILFLVFFLNFY